MASELYKLTMTKEFVKLQSVGNAVTRIIDLNGELLRRKFPNADKGTPLYGKWAFDEHSKKYILDVIESKEDPNKKE